MPPERRDEGVLAQAKKLLSKSVALIESLIGKNFLAGEFSGADIMLARIVYVRLLCVR